MNAPGSETPWRCVPRTRFQNLERCIDVVPRFQHSKRFSRARAPDQMTHEMQCGVRTRVISKEVGNGECSQISPTCINNHRSLKRFILSCTGFGKSFIAKFRVVPAVRGGITQPWNQTFAERYHGYGCSFPCPVRDSRNLVHTC